MGAKQRWSWVTGVVLGLAVLAWMAAGKAEQGAGGGAAGPPPPPLGEARWISPPERAKVEDALPLFRKEFDVAAGVVRSSVRVVGLGDYDLFCNGERLADTGINQPWSQYDKTIYYRQFDITSVTKPGANCLGVMLTHSFWHNANPPAGRYYKVGPQREAPEPLLLSTLITLEYSDGKLEHIGTDATWRTTDGPIVFSHIFAGEDYDARRRIPGWDRAGFDDSTWRPARLAEAPRAELVRQHWPSVRALDRFAPVSITEPAPGVYLYRFPQNCSAQLRVALAGGRSGHRVAFRGGEHRNAEDRVFGHYVVGWNLVTDGRPLVHQWSSFYLGMQFVEVTGAVPSGVANPDGLPVIESMELVHVRTALPEVGTFESSSDVFSGTHALIDWAMRSNMSHVLTDCPHREKLGWLECAYLLAPSLAYRYDCRDWFEKIVRDIRDAQEPSGRVLTVAPGYPAGRFPSEFDWTVEWGAASVLLPWQHYRWYGDARILRDSFDMMRRFTDHIGTEASHGLAPGGLGDWYDYGHGGPPGPSRFTPTQLSATATWALCAAAVAHAAEALGLAEEAARYRGLHTEIAASFRQHFRDRDTGRLHHGGSPQCANAMALCADVVPPTDRALLVDEIIADLERRDWQQTPGDVGHVYFIRALAEAGRSDVLHRVYAREGLGSYGGILKKGLTTMPETWDAMMDGYQSLNHCMLGHVIEWYYGYVLGIRQQPDSVGWERVVIGPNVGELTYAEGSLMTPRGLITSRWRVEDGVFRIHVEIPDGVEAIAVLPSGHTQLLGSGKQEILEHR